MKKNVTAIMRVTTVALGIIIGFSSLVFASESRAQKLNEVKVTISIKNENMADVLARIETSTGISFSYDKNLLGKLRVSSQSYKGESLPVILKNLLKNTGYDYEIINNNIVVGKEKPAPKPPKPGRISGRILDDKGETLPGASIRVIETGAGVQAGADGSYILNLQPGTYSLEISYISFRTQRITGVVVTDKKNTPLDISLKPAANGLKEVTVTSGYKKASAAGLLVRQKNASEIGNGISAEQIARTPDKNIGESLKRISGVSTVDNKFVLVRGIGERYNSAMLDGVVLPSTEAQSRNFSFDMIPSNMVDNVVVSKTVTPDMNASFGGGLIQINTKDIPNENFASFTVGASFNDQTTGKDFLSHKRGKYDYFGFDDGRREFPKDLMPTARDNEQNMGLTDEQYWKKVTDQSLRFKNDNFTLYKYKAIPSQNYQFSIGRLIALDTANNNKLGFTGSLSYRNTQSINIINQQNRGSWDPNLPNTGNTYDFNTIWGGLLNAGLQLGKNNRFSLRNTYTHVYDNALMRIVGYDQNGITDNPPNRIEESDDPIYTDLLQNKLSGQHQFGKIKIDWDAARTSINRKEKDLSIVNSYSSLVSGQYEYFPSVGNSSSASFFPTSRQNYANREINYSWDVSATIPFNLAGIRSSVKSGYFGNRKKAKFDWLIAAFTDDPATPNDARLQFASIAEMQKPENIGKNGLFYTVNPLFSDTYEGESRNHAGFIMLDNRFGEKLRLVWGIRGEYYKYNEINNGTNTRFQVYSLKPDPRWQWLPSANLTYNPLATLNIRAAYSSSIVRPELMDNSQFWRYRADLGGQYGNQGLYSTKIDSWDFKTEWFPALGEIISAGAFYKKFDKPAELNINTQSGNLQYYLKSADWAKVYGLEFELRKSLGFIADYQILNNISVYGNLTLQKSDVKATFLGTNPDPTQPPLELSSKLNRYMYGQSPYVTNVSLQYTGTSLGVNVMFNKSGYKTYIVGEDPTQIEYERPRQQIDAQVSYRFFSKKLELKVNAGNLLNTASTFYRNTESYEPNPDYKAGTGDISDAVRLKPGFTNKYEDGDRLLFSQKFGRTYSTSLTYAF
jgi:outer membrane receptor protein involved in Fe transport